MEPSILVEELESARLTVVKEQTSGPAARIFVDEALSIDPVELGGDRCRRSRVGGGARGSQQRDDSTRITARPGPSRRRAWSVSAIETYLTCPFKFFAQYVMRLDEEPDDEEVMDPKQQGRFVHEVFEAFFRRGSTRAIAALRRRISARPGGCSRSGRGAPERLYRRPRRHSNGRGCWGRRSPPGLERSCFEWRRSGRPRSSSVCSSTGWAASSSSPAPGIAPDCSQGSRRSARPARRRDVSIDRLQTSSAPNKSRALQLPIYGCARSNVSRTTKVEAGRSAKPRTSRSAGPSA